MPVIPDTAAIEVAPDWVCEVISPATETLDRGKKLAVYAREEILHAWLINPTSGALEVLRLTGGHWMLLATHMGARTYVPNESHTFVKTPWRIRCGCRP